MKSRQTLSLAQWQTAAHFPGLDNYKKIADYTRLGCKIDEFALQYADQR
ncbi:MAG: hypothetical protein L0Y73_08270 [Candidatus Aminicenantes bacterium]|nr:hypothetical protein [Candidatus Aminicenantes bacterium]